MAFADEVKKTVNRQYVDVYLKRRYPDGSFDADWIDITRWVVGNGIDKIRYSLDSGDFDVGIFAANNVRMKFDNSSGKFNDNSDPRSYWAAFQSKHLSQIKIEAGYITDDDEKSEATPFHGILDESSMNHDSSDNVSITILSRESALKRVSVVAGSLSSSVSASDAIYILCNRSEITDYITVTTSNIVPGNDIALDDPSVYNNKKLDAVLNDLLLLTNSIMYVDNDGNLIVKDRENTSTVKYYFYANSHDGKKDNIYSITGVNTGRQRIKNAWFWGNTSLSAQSDSHHLKRFGTIRKSISSDAITTTATKQSILDNALAGWQFPKSEMIIAVDYMPGVLDFYDTIVLDIKPNLSRYYDLPIAGAAVAGADLLVDYQSGMYIDKNLGFKILSIDHDIRTAKTYFKIREKGNQLNDGYIEMINTKLYTLVFTASASEDINVGADGIDAQRCKVEILDAADDYKTNLLTVTRPDSNTIRIAAGSAITETYRVLVVEVEA